MGIWVDAARASMRMVLNELAATRREPLEGDEMELAEEPHWTTLEGMLNDYSFARVLDVSDLVARLEGPSVESGTPAVLLSRIVGDMWKQVKTATTAAVALSNTKESAFAGWAPRWPERLSMDVTGTGEGSLVLGFRASRDSHPGIGFPDTGFREMHSVMSGIAEAPRFFTDTGVSEEIAQRFPDHAIRDSILSAIYNLAPTGRRGIAAVTFYEGGQPKGPPRAAVPLTAATRKFLKPLLDKPVSGDSRDVFRGTIRAADLDARRFVLRSVPELGTVRCAYPASLDAPVRDLLVSGARVAVQGSYESANWPRLVQVEGEIEVEE